MVLWMNLLLLRAPTMAITTTMTTVSPSEFCYDPRGAYIWLNVYDLIAVIV
jgi:hypothetical protein